MNATESLLGYMPPIGSLVVPHSMSSSEGNFDTLMHSAFELYSPARRGCYVEYDTLNCNRAAQYAYQLPWNGGHQDVPRHMKFDTLEDENALNEAFFLVANFEADYLELAGGCILDVCLDGDKRPRAMLELGEVAQWPATSATPLPSWHFGLAVQKLADAIAVYMGTIGDRSLFRGVVIAGSASEQSMMALRVAVGKALSDIDDTRIYGKIQPAYVFSLGASVVGRNMQLHDERQDCDCSVAEHHRRSAGLAVDSEFPCDRQYTWMI
ncbi:MAG: hypothetical protein STHCBS139747_003450 [Sporothrix thermara]